MKANNLTISVDAPCNQDCPFCISKMTFAPKPDRDLFRRNIRKARTLALAAGVTSVLITSKGEPTLNMEDTEFVLDQFREFPTEIQTNGTTLTKDILYIFYTNRLNTVAVSAYKLGKAQDEIFELIRHYKFNARLTMVLTDKMRPYTFRAFMDFCDLHDVRQLTFRRATVPSITRTTKEVQDVVEWIHKNTDSEFADLFRMIKMFETPENLIRSLPWGAKVYNVMGIAITIIDYCIQESNNTDDIRSLIYHQDGHMYTSWACASSILF